MRVKDFAEKYGLEYSVVYTATWLIKRPMPAKSRNDYDEEELEEAVRQAAVNRVCRLEGELDKAKGILEKINGALGKAEKV